MRGIMSAREAIFGKIRHALEGVPRKAHYPEFDTELVVSRASHEGGNLGDLFVRQFTAAGGKALHTAKDLVDFLIRGGYGHGYCDPAIMPELGDSLNAADLSVETTYDRNRYEDYRFGITRATGGIAESGTLILDDTHTSDRLAALSPWVHVAVLRRECIHRTIPDALAALGPSRNVIWITGPSKTADVEGILIEGVHGPGEQIALLL